MVPLSTLANIKPTGGPDVIYRYNRFRAIQILGGPAPGYSSGQASDAMAPTMGQILLDVLKRAPLPSDCGCAGYTSLRPPGVVDFPDR